MSSRFWIVTTSADNIDLIIKHKMIGLPAKRKKHIYELAEGDIIVFYIGKKRAGYTGYKSTVCDFGPIARIVGQAFYDENPIWYSRSGENYPWRREISVILSKRIKVQAIINRISFARNKPKWGLYFVRGLREIPEEDYNTLRKALKT